MSKSVNVVLIKQKSTEDWGTINIRTIEKSVSKKKSTGIQISVIDWDRFFNPETQRFRGNKLFPLSENYNDIIEHHLSEIKKFNDISNIPDDKKSFIDYWERYITTIDNHGTRIKHEVVLNKLKKYLITKDNPNLLFKEIDIFFIRDLKFYLSNIKDPKSLSSNTLNHYLKVIKSIINKSEVDDYYHYLKNPFNSLRFKQLKTEKGVINDIELNDLLNKTIDNEKLDLVRKMFLFQLFCNGMRVSDLLLLRWNNFVDGRLVYTMFKTKEIISIPINLNMGLIIGTLVKRDDRYIKIVENLKEDFLINGKIDKWDLKKIETRLKEITIIKHGLERKDLIKLSTPDYTHSNGIIFSKKNEIEVYQLLKSKDELLTIIDKVYVNSLEGRMKSNKDKLNPTDFVFPVLKNEMFSNIGEDNDFSKITVEQYKTIKNKTIVYDRQLKKVQILCGIDTNISSHVSRHTFTNHLLEVDNSNLYDISQSLGHKNITITQNYITSGFNNKKIDYLNKELSNKYRKERK